MPSGLVATARTRILNGFDAMRLRRLARRGERERERDAQVARAIDELERRQRVQAEAADLRAEIQALRERIRSDPHDAYRSWLNRTHISYDAQAYRAGRLQRASSDRSRRRNDYSDVLDEDINDLGEDERTFLRNVERVQDARTQLDRLRARLSDHERQERERRQQFRGPIPRYLREIYA